MSYSPIHLFNVIRHLKTLRSDLKGDDLVDRISTKDSLFRRNKFRHLLKGKSEEMRDWIHTAICRGKVYGGKPLAVLFSKKMILSETCRIGMALRILSSFCKSKHWITTRFFTQMNDLNMAINEIRELANRKGDIFRGIPHVLPRTAWIELT